jgi:hypothetical protein
MDESYFMFSAVASILVIAFSLLVWRSYCYILTLPPAVDKSFVQILMMLADGSVTWYYYEQFKKQGKLFRWPKPFWSRQMVICCDIDITKSFLEGQDSVSGVSPSFHALDKPTELKAVDRMTFGRPSMITKKTLGEGWDWARKGKLKSETSQFTRRCQEWLLAFQQAISAKRYRHLLVC